jgi:hypothetical protein
MRTYIVTISQPGGSVRLIEITSNSFRSAVSAAFERLHEGETILRLTITYNATILEHASN